MNWQQIVMIVYLSLMVGVGLVADGTPRTGKNSFLMSLVTAVFIAVILYTGGFWS